MITTKNELKKYLQADFIMNRGDCSFKKRLISFITNDLVMKYLKVLRKLEYRINKKSKLALLYQYKLKSIGQRIGITIAPNVLGYGVVIPHYGTIIVGEGNQIGNFCVLHTSTCIGAGKKTIGDAFYLSAGAKVFKDINIADNVSIGANSLVDKNINQPNSLYGGVPAKFIKESEPWYIRDGQQYLARVQYIRSLFGK